MKAITKSHINKILQYFNEEKLTQLKKIIIDECKDIAIDFIDAKSDAFNNTMKEQYDYKSDLIRIIMDIENKKFGKSNNINGRVI